jgi:flagellar biosynthesis activator protein FlaF
MMQSKQAASAYKTNQQGTQSLRETEARALLSCANRLHEAQMKEHDVEVYLDAIRHNQQLWTIFQVTLCEPENPLPRDLKITLLNLSRFVDKVSLRAQSEYNLSLLTSLIDINRQIAAGLSVTVGGDAPMQASLAGSSTSVPASPVSTSV